MQFGNPLIAVAQFTPGQVDQLYTGTSGTTAGAGSLIIPVIALNSYVAVAIVNAGAVPNCVAVEAFNNSASVAVGSSCGVPRQPNANDLLILPISCNAGDTLDVVFDVNAASTGHAVSIVGLTSYPNLPLQRPDGRLYPMGNFSASTFLIAAGSTPLIAAPGAGLRIHIHSLSFSCTGSGAGLGGSINATVNTVAGPIVESTQAGMFTMAPPQGILCDTNTAVNLSQSGAGATTGSVLYDIVPT